MVSSDELGRQLNDKKFLKSLLAIAYKFTGRKDVAEDIVYETIEDILKLSGEQLGRINDLGQYAKTIAFRNGIKWVKSKVNTYEKPAAQEAPETAAYTDPLSSLELKEVMAVIHGNRNQTDITVADMVYQGYDYEEIAGAIRESESYVRRRMFEIRNWLRNHYRHEGTK